MGEPLLKFRHLLEAHELTRRIFEEVGALLAERKLLMKEGTIASALRRCLRQAVSLRSAVDATIIAAPSSTKNARKERDPEPERSGDSRPNFSINVGKCLRPGRATKGISE